MITNSKKHFKKSIYSLGFVILSTASITNVLADIPTYGAEVITGTLADCGAVGSTECGTSNGKTLAIAPVTDLCATGSTATTVVDAGTKFTWNCNDAGGNVGACSATKSSNVGAECGPLHGTTVKTWPFWNVPENNTDLCSKGIPVGIGSNPGAMSISWQCRSLNFVDFKIANGSWGYYDNYNPANGTYIVDNGATHELLTPIFQRDIDDGIVKECSVSKDYELNYAKCGLANGKTLAYKPTALSDLCQTGLVFGAGTNIVDPNKWSWKCLGYHTNGFSSDGTPIVTETYTTNAECSATKLNSPNLDGKCSSIDGTTQTKIGSNFATCASDGGIKDFVEMDTKYTWTCNGVGTGSNASCSVNKPDQTIVNGECGTADGGSFAVNPSTNLCKSGIPTFPHYGGSTPTGVIIDYYTWRCMGFNGGASPSCSATKSSPQCGSANGTTSSTAPTVNLCADGNLSIMVDRETQFTWECVGVLFDKVPCSATKASGSIVGVCGDYNGQQLIEKPIVAMGDGGLMTKHLCSTGTFDSIETIGNTYKWNCNATPCSAQQIDCINDPGACGGGGGGGGGSCNCGPCESESYQQIGLGTYCECTYDSSRNGC